MTEERLCVRSVVVRCGTATADLLAYAGRKEYDGRPKFSIKEPVPIGVDLHFTVRRPVKLLLAMRGFKTSDGVTAASVMHSYQEYMGHFEPSEQEVVYTVKEFIPTANNPILRMNLVKTVLRVTDPLGNELFAVDFFFSFKLSLLSGLLDGGTDAAAVRRDNSSDGSRSSLRHGPTTPPAAATTSAQSGAQLSTTPPAMHWSQVERRQLPAETSKTIRSLIEHDDTNPDAELNTTDKKMSTGDIVKELGFWLYSTNVGQYFVKFGDDRARLGDVKEVYDLAPIHMLGFRYSFLPTGADDTQRHSSDEVLMKKTVRAPQLSEKKFVGRSHDDMFKKGRLRRIKSVQLPKRPRQQPHSLVRYGSLGDAYSIREVRRFPATFTSEQMRQIASWLGTQKFHIKWYDEFNIDGEEDGKTSLVKNAVFIRFHADPDPEKRETVVDFNIFAAFKKTSLAFYLSPVGAEVETRASKMVWVLGKLVDVMESFSRKSEIVFAEGFNADVIASPRLADLLEEKDDEPAREVVDMGPVQGELLLLDEKNNLGWVKANAHLEDGIFSVSRPPTGNATGGGGEEGSSIPIKMAAVKMASSGSQMDIHFNGMAYHFRAEDAPTFSRWYKAMRGAAGFLEADVQPEPTSPREGATTVREAAFDSPELVEADEEREPVETKDDGDVVVLTKDEHRDEPTEEVTAADPKDQATLVQFLQNFQSRFWITYRKDFPKIEPSSFTSDVGWGCMLRTAQMLLSQAFVHALLTRDWRIHERQTEESLAIYRHILLWFADDNNPDSHYSLHNMARTGRKLDKKIGEWFGPCTAAYVLRRLSAAHKGCPLTFYVNQDQAIYLDLIREQAVVDGVWKPVLILLPVRLGVVSLNPVYHKSLKRLFGIPQFLGIAGGKPCKSLYFVARQNNELFYLDPHIVRPYCPIQGESMFPVESYHCDTVRTTTLQQLDPSMLLGFLVQSPEDLLDFKQRAAEITSATQKIFDIHEAAPAYVKSDYYEELFALGLGKHLKRQ